MPSFFGGLAKGMALGQDMKRKHLAEQAALDAKKAALKQQEFENRLKLGTQITDAYNVKSKGGQKIAIDGALQLYRDMGYPVPENVDTSGLDFSAPMQEITNALKGYNGNTTAAGRKDLLFAGIDSAYEMASELFTADGVDEFKASAEKTIDRGIERQEAIQTAQGIEIGQLTPEASGLTQGALDKAQATALQRGGEGGLAILEEERAAQKGIREGDRADRLEAEDKREIAADIKVTKAKNDRVLKYSKIVVSNIDEAIGQIDGWTTSYGGILASWPGTKARTLKGTLGTIRANVSFEELMSMKNSSKTGGALGQVSERELTSLEAVLGSLDQLQEGPELTKNLNDIKKHYENAVRALTGDMSEVEAEKLLGQKSVTTKDGTVLIFDANGKRVQ